MKQAQHGVIRGILLEELLLPLAADHVAAHTSAVRVLGSRAVAEAMGEGQVLECIRTLVESGCREGEGCDALGRSWEELCEVHNDRLRSDSQLLESVDKMIDECKTAHAQLQL